jgi:hypothetical protein
MRGAAYIDGFNLYHAIDDLNQPHLKWVNLRRLVENLSRGHATWIGPVVFCTAYFPSNDFGKRIRHEAYVNALSNVDVTVKFGHIVHEPMSCKDCRRRWMAPREKETDINVSLSMVGDASRDVFDVAFLVTADTDQAATLRHMRDFFPQKKLVTVFPPGRPPSKHLRDLSDATMQLTPDHLDLASLPILTSKEGRKAIVRPFEYAPPAGWVHPDDRQGRSSPAPPT